MKSWEQNHIQKRKDTLTTGCDFTLCLTSKSPLWLKVLDSKNTVLLFSTSAKLNLQLTQHWSVINSILSRICGVLSHEFTQTLRPPMLAIFRYQSSYGEQASVRFFWRSSTATGILLVDMESATMHAHCVGACEANGFESSVPSSSCSRRFDISIFL